MGEGYDRQGSFASKSILEPGFNAWFQISLAAVTANTATRANFAAIALSIISSLLAAGKGMVCMAPRLSFWWKGRNDPDRPWRFHNFWTNAIPFLLGLVLFPAMAVRVVGIWICRSHVLNLTNGCVPVL